MSTRLFVSEALSNGATLELHGEHARYIGRVLRARVGDPVFVFNGEDGEWRAEITGITKSVVSILVQEHHETLTESSLKLHLVQGISRGERMDFVVQKATELGVKRISPVLTEYGVVRLDAARIEKRRDHWESVAASACEQSGRTRLPLIDAPMTLNDWFGNKPADVDAELILTPGATTSLAQIETPSTKVCLLIGPEGGFSESEYEDAAITGFAAVSLGPRILRTETAAVAALSVLQSIWGDLA